MHNLNLTSTAYSSSNVDYLLLLLRFQSLSNDDEKRQKEKCANDAFGDACDVPSFPCGHESHEVLQ
jgi:hypothetical protein